MASSVNVLSLPALNFLTCAKEFLTVMTGTNEVLFFIVSGLARRYLMDGRVPTEEVMITLRGVVGMLAGASVFAFSANAQETASPQTANTEPVAVAGETVEAIVIETEADPAPERDALAEAAATYATYQVDVTIARDKPFQSPEDIETSLTNFGIQQPEAMTSGWLAYSALVAAQTPEFEESLKKSVAYYGSDRIARGLANDISYASTFAGSDKAVSRALSAIAADTKRINGTADIVKEQAYSLQSKGWAKARFGDGSAKVADMRRGTAMGRPVAPAMLEAMQAPDLGASLKGAADPASSIWDTFASTSGYTLKVPTLGLGNLSAIPLRRVRFGQEPVADRIVTLAAFRAIGESGMSSAPQLSRALTEERTTACLEKAQLNLYQCVGAVHNQFEAPFCIGKHALEDVSTCFGAVAE